MIRSATPAFSTADALSPPPMMVTAFDEASALAISFVPLANSSISKTPTGPFQMIVPADRIASLKSATVPGPISTPIMSAGILSIGTTFDGAPAAGSAAITASTGTMSFR